MIPTMLQARREWLQRTALGFGSLAFQAMLQQEASAESQRQSSDATQMLRSRPISPLGPSGRVHVHDRWPVAGRYIRSEAATR